uniref:GOST seven transmembrane domain-containing protein n=1 Tax=Oryza punctata TaxID=4537 RepID=A0A0E0LNA3_ORYPU
MSMMPSMRRLLLAGAAAAVVVVSCAVICAEASVHEYAGERFAGVGNGFVLHGGSEGVYASATAESFVRFEKVAFRRTPEAASVAEEDGNRTVTVAAVIFEAGDRDALGGSDVVGGERVLCCTPGMARLGGCTEGAVVYRAAPAASGWPKLVAASFLPGCLVAAFPDETVAVARTGMYNLLFVHCDASLAAGQVVAVEGKTIWKNSRGYLPGRMAPLKPFYGVMSLAFAALAALWFVRYARFWREVSPLQNFATAAIALGMVEVTTWYLDLAEFDVSGVRPAGTTFWAATSGAVRGAACRVLVLLVAMGYGVTRPALGCANAKVAILGAAFLAAAEVLDVGENVGIVSDHSPARRLFFILPVAALNTVFIYWIFTSLSRTISKLKARRMTTKLEMYRKFANSLTIAVALSLGWITFEVHFKTTDEHNERWRVAWVIPAVWELISFFLLCAICLLWAPSQNSMRFAYSGEEGEDDTEHDDVEDTRPLIRAGPLSYADNWACYVTHDAKIILRTDSGVYAKAGEEYKRV